MKRIFIVAIICIVTIAGCKKYEEGPLISFRSKTQRVAGRKELMEYKVNGIDSLSWLQDSIYGCPKVNFIFTRDKRKDPEEVIITGTVQHPCKSIAGSWGMKNKGTVLDMSSNSNNFHLMGGWNILKLTYKEMWLSRKQNGKLYELKFKSTKV